MTTPDDPDMTAAELALGVLEGEERAAANRRLLADPVFARDVARWRAHFATLFAEVPEVVPPPQLEERILAALDPAQDRDAGRTLRRWRWFGGGMTAVAAALLVTLLARPAALPPRPVPRPDAPLVATLAPGDATSIAAVYDRAAGRVHTIGRMTVPADRDAELWAIGRDGVPRALGLLRRDGRTQMVVRGVTIDQTTTLAVSIEPIGGSPGPLPTGPVVATGQLSLI